MKTLSIILLMFSVFVADLLGAESTGIVFDDGGKVVEYVFSKQLAELIEKRLSDERIREAKVFGKPKTVLFAKIKCNKKVFNWYGGFVTINRDEEIIIIMLPELNGLSDLYASKMISGKFMTKSDIKNWESNRNKD